MQSLLLLLLLLGALAAISMVSPCHAFTQPATAMTSRCLGSSSNAFPTAPITSPPSQLQARQDEDEDQKKNQALDNLTSGPDFTTFTFAAGILVIVAGFVLNSFGYDYIVKDGRVTIGTIEERQFQNEVNRVSKQKNKAAVPVTSISSANYVSGDSNTSVLQLAATE